MTAALPIRPIALSTQLCLAGLVLFVLVTTTISWPRLQERYTNAAQSEAQSVLRLVGDAVDQTVLRYQHLPTLIADDPILLELLAASDNQGLVPFVNEKLRLQAVTIGASDVYVMDTEGTTVATSNYRSERSFLGRNFAYRPYFQEALAGEITQFHALGTTSGERGFFFAAPVLQGIEVVGVMAVKVTVDDIEEAWAQTSRDTIVADANGIAFLASRPEYRMRALAPLSVDILTQIEQTQQFPISSITPIPLSASVVSPGIVEVTLGDDQETRYLSNSVPLALPGWHAIVLSPVEEVSAQVINALAIRLLIGTAVILSALIVFQRWTNLLERMKAEKQMRDQLEVRVQERTADLNTANESLRSEIQERKNTEQELRTTQTHLIQAGKLAALGQMSAAISHEINQPLGAMKSYADNALLYLERDRIDEAGANIKTISQMTDRVAEISRSLRNFARRPGDTLTAVPLSVCIQEALSIFEPQLRNTGAEVSFAPPLEEVWVQGGRLRLQQVIINSLTNALDAMQGDQTPKIEITIHPRDDRVAVEIRDFGPGVPAADQDKVFEAFYTTKQAGVGMGLGLSISYNIVEDFGGTLSVQNHPEGGAVFCVELVRVAEPALPRAAE